MIGKGKTLPVPSGGKSDADIVAQVAPGYRFEPSLAAESVAEHIVRRHSSKFREAMSKLTLNA